MVQEVLGFRRLPLRILVFKGLVWITAEDEGLSLRVIIIIHQRQPVIPTQV